jgi:hypothetical protein
MAQRPSGHARVLDDFYAEPVDCTEALIAAFDWVAGAFHDPFVGSGSTVAAAAQHGITATGADLVDRCGGRFPVRDFFADTACYSNLVTNPPFVRAAEAIEYGGGRIAILADLNFLSAQRRYALHTRPEFELLLVLMKRPSCPPGAQFLAGTIKRGNGGTNYGWFVYQRARPAGPPRLVFAPPYASR